MMIADNSIRDNTSNSDQSCTAPVGEAQRRRSLEAIAQLSFGFFGEDGKDMGTSEEEEEKPQAPWKVNLKPTGKGGDIRQGVSLAAPITFFPKDDSRLYHDGVNSLQLKSAETMERKTKDDSRLYHEGVNNLTLRETEIQMRKATGSCEFERPKLRNRSKSPVPNAPKPTSRDRSLSPVPDRSKGASRSRSKTPRSATPETTEKAVPVPIMEEKKEALADQEQTDNGSGMTPQPTTPEVSERPALVPVTGEKKQAPVRQHAPNKITDKKLSELKEQVQDLQRQLKKSKGKIQDLSTENKILTQQLVQGRQAVLPRTSSNCTSCKESKASLTALKQEKGVLESNIIVLMDQVGTVQKEKENFQEQFLAASSSHSKEVQDMKSQLISQQDLENRNLTLQDTITKVQKEKECLQSQLEASTVEHQKELQELRSHLEAQEDSGSNNQELQERIVSLKKEKGDLLVELETSSGKHQEELQEVQFQLEEQTTQAASLQNDLEQATTDSQRVEQLTLELDASNRDSQVLQVALSGAQVETAALQSQLAKDTAQVESLKQEVEVVSRDAQNSVTKLQSEMDAARDGLEQSQTLVQELQNERDNVIAQLQEAEEQRGNLQLAAAERSAKLQQLTVQVDELLETCKKNEADKSTLQSDFLDQIQATEERLNDLQKENDAIESEKQEIKLRLEEQVKECQSIRRKLEEAVFEKGQANDSIVKLQTEAELTKQEFQKVQQSLKEAQQERDEALSNLKATEAKGREVIESSMEENKKFLVEAQEKIAALEAAVSRVEAAKKDVELDYVEMVDAQERKIQEMKQENDAMETQLTTVTVEKKDAQHLIAEKEKVLESTNLQLEEAQQQLKETAFENGVVLEKLNATVDKCQAAMAATEAMKGFLEEDEKTILQLHSKMNKMEADLLKRVTTSSSTERDKVGLGFEVDVEALERGMNFPTDDDEDSLAYLDVVDVQEHSKNRRSSIMALEELEQELKTLMCSSNEILPGVKNGRSSNSSPKSGSRKQSMNGGRQMSLFVKQKQRDSIEEEVLSDIRET